ncbi:hypothetical protein D3C84_1286730 [compost metagenome]
MLAEKASLSDIIEHACSVVSMCGTFIDLAASINASGLLGFRPFLDKKSYMLKNIVDVK